MVMHGREASEELTQSSDVIQTSARLSILPSTAAPFQAKTRGSTSFGGGMIWTFSIYGTSGVAIACNLWMEGDKIVMART